MQIERLDHVNLRTAQLSVMKAWYGDVLGLHAGPRPDFPFPGAWLYAGDAAVIHLVAIDGAPGPPAQTDLTLEHFAFTARGAAAMEARLTAHEVPFRRVVVEGTGMVAFNLHDPDGNHIHVDFAVDE